MSPALKVHYDEFQFLEAISPDIRGQFQELLLHTEQKPSGVKTPCERYHGMGSPAQIPFPNNSLSKVWGAAGGLGTGTFSCWREGSGKTSWQAPKVSRRSPRKQPRSSHQHTAQAEGGGSGWGLKKAKASLVLP